jgi:hypothetical protein
MSLYAATCIPTPNIKVLREALLTFRPTSTQNERNFSKVGKFVVKQRSKLPGTATNVLCVLKIYFQYNNF